MNEEDRKQLEDAAAVAREKADKAHEAAANADGQDEALNAAADEAENQAVAAQAALDAAAESEESSEQEPESEESEQDIDFKKELDSLPTQEGQPPAVDPKKNALQKAERALFFQAKEVEKLGGDPSKIVKTEAPRPEPEDRNQEQPQEGNFVTREELARRDLRTEIRKLSRSDEEFQVTLWHAENTIRSKGDPVKDAENAYLIAHKGRIQRSFDEIRRSVSTGRPSGPSLPGRKPVQQARKAPMLPPEQVRIMERRGFKQMPDGTWEGKRYRMVYDQTKKTFVTVPKK